MKKAVFILGLLFGLIGILQAQDDQNELQISGNLITHQRILTDDGTWIWNENRLETNFEKKVAENSKFFAQVWLRNLGLPNFYHFSALYNHNNLQPVNIRLRELYADVYGLLNNKLDLRIGKQIINWGTADKINPTNNLNPYDYEDILDFGRKTGVWALKFDFYFNDNFSAEGVLIPLFTPATLPYGIFSDILQQNQQPENLIISQFSDSLILPEYKADNISGGIRLKGFALNTDFSLSYVYGFADLPLPSYNSLFLIDTPNIFTMKTQLNFYRQHIFGFDFATNIKGIGLWGEFGLFLPEKQQIMTTEITIPFFNPISGKIEYITNKTDSVLLDDKPYLKFVVGADYTFGSGFYLNVQYIHGFLFERGDQLNDYLFLRFEKSMFFDKLKIAPISGGFVITDWDDIQNNYAYAYFPQIIYKPVEDIEISLGAGLFDGKGDNWFVNLKDYNMLIFRIKYSF